MKVKIVKPIIYLITNLVNGKIYVGKTINPKQRWQDHKSPKTKKYPVQYAIQKYGAEKFVFDILEEYTTETDLSEAEIWWIAYFRSLGAQMYNITDGGDGISGYKHTDETKQLLSHQKQELLASGWQPPKHTDEFKQQRSQDMLGHTINVGRKHPAGCEHCLQLKLRNIDNNPAKDGWSKKTILKMSQQKLGSQNNNAIMTEEKVKQLRQLATDGFSNKELAIMFGISPSNVSDIKCHRTWKHI